MKNIIFYSSIILLGSCVKASLNCEQGNFFEGVEERNFAMGFTTWNYAPQDEAVEDTYDFILGNGDVYAEQIDEYVPWASLINGTPLPSDFLLKMEYKAVRKPQDLPLSLSVSFLDTDRSDLLPDLDGSRPESSGFDDPTIIDAYEKHLNWLISKFNPDYLTFAMEVNELFTHDREKWDAYKNFSREIRSRLRIAHPELELSESITLHNWFEPENGDQESYNLEMKTFVEGLDFASISFYPFLTGLESESGYQRAFDFLHSQVSTPIGIVETNQLAETLEINAYNLTIKADPCSQKEYLETLLLNAQSEDYAFVIWWSHRDYDELWETFPDEVKDIGKIWRDTGLIDEDGNERIAFSSWKRAFEK